MYSKSKKFVQLLDSLNAEKEVQVMMDGLFSLSELSSDKEQDQEQKEPTMKCMI